MSQRSRKEETMYDDIKLFSGTGCVALAEEISTLLKVPLTGRDIVEYPNENLFIRLHESVRGKDVFIIQTTSSPVNRNIMELLIMLDTLKRASAGRITVVIPYFAYARSDKKDQPRVPITARLLADLITIAGADRYMLIDLHAGQIQGFFSIPGDELTAFPILSDYYKNKYGLVPEFKAGLHYGDVIITEIGGAKEELAYHGDTVNTAARIQTVCNERGKQIIVSAELLSILNDKNLDKKYSFKSEGITHLKGKKFAIGIFSVEENSINRVSN